VIYSYLPKKDILQVQNAISGKVYEAMYGAFRRYILKNARAAMDFSVERYLRIFE